MKSEICEIDIDSKPFSFKVEGDFSWGQPINTFILKNNINSTHNLVKLAIDYKVKYFVFSSSASIYGNIKFGENIKENTRPNPINPYGITKVVIEEIEKSIVKQTTETETTDTFKFKVSDGTLESNEANVTVNITIQPRITISGEKSEIYEHEKTKLTASIATEIGRAHV